MAEIRQQNASLMRYITSTFNEEFYVIEIILSVAGGTDFYWQLFVGKLEWLSKHQNPR